ncbi:hypothetical protein AVEN_186878-1 [Araneus ventricosus]|uniref:Uncharacterized protein n=1 Tax=Araneus ventricosus TaxID=182803 RepID=A0A4Y2R6W4_ARAVE|nr:hypothetical protein AVEN_186878-1 [Araneus ventricosus]
MGRFLASSSVKRRATPPRYLFIMATTLDTEFNAIPQVNPKVVLPKSKGSRMSLVKQKEKKDVSEAMVTTLTTGNFITKFGAPATVLPPPTTTPPNDWGAITKDFPDESDHVTSVEPHPSDPPAPVPIPGLPTNLAELGPSSPSFSSGVDEDTMQSDGSSTETTDSSNFYEVRGTPQARHINTYKSYLKGKPKTKRSEVTTQEVQPMEQDTASGRRKRSAGKKGQPHQ